MEAEQEQKGPYQQTEKTRKAKPTNSKQLSQGITSSQPISSGNTKTYRQTKKPPYV